MRIAIEAGHGGKDSGAIGYNRFEKDDNLKLALSLKNKFIYQGFDVSMTRETDVTMSYTEKCKKENFPKCDLAIACHRNAFTDPKSNGFEIWVHSQASNNVVKWADDVCKDIATSGMSLRGTGVFKGFRGSPDKNYYWNSGTKSPSMLIELGFITNEKDNKLFDNNLEFYVDSIVKASCNFLKVQYKK